MNTIISQALATGLPVITTRHSGLPDQVIDGKNGFLVQEADYEALAEKIIEYIKNPNLHYDFSVYGREHVEKTYDSSVLIEKQIQYYQSIVEDL